MASATSVSLGDIKRARAAIRDYINLSPCILSPSLSGRSECKLHLKMENLQRTGAYKDRGAMNAVLGLDDAHKKAGVLAASAGNHHGRTFTSAAFRETEIELMVETRGPEAVEALLRTMAERISGAAFQVRVARQTTRLAQS